MRTKGKWKTEGTGIKSDSSDFYIAGCYKLIKKEEAYSNATFIAMCGTIANQLDEMGFDGEKAIEMLPKIIKIIYCNKKQYPTCPDNCWECFDSIKNKLQQPQP